MTEKITIGSEWVSRYEDDLPPDYVKILFLCKGIVKYGYYGIKGWWSYSHVNGFILESKDVDVTHWMALP